MQNEPTMTHENAFSPIDPFENISEEEKSFLLGRMDLKNFTRRTVIFSDGDPSDDVYFIKEGRIRTYKTTITGQELTTGLWSRGYILGLLSAITHRERFLSAETLDHAEMYCISIAELEKMSPEVPQFFLNLMRAIATTAATGLERVIQQATDSAASRLASVLISLAQLPESKTETGEYVVGGISQEDIALMVSASRPWVSNILSEFQERGLIKLARKKIIIPSIEELEKERENLALE